MKVCFGIFLVLFTFCESGRAQGFVDLNFENATIVPDTSSPYYPYAVYASSALPGWTVSGVTFLPTNEILYNDITLGDACVSIMGTNGNPAALAGKYSVYLYNGVSISQTGVVPAQANSLDFIAFGANDSLLTVSLDGQNISFIPLSGTANYTEYGGNLPAGMDGLSEQLVFSALAGQNNNWVIDNIQFSPTLVPEPNALGLFALGGLFFVWHHRQKFFKTKA